MPFESAANARKKIAVVGAGISGMGAAYMLGSEHNVTLIEAAPRLGGHARTVLAGRRGDQPVDTGFIVFNYANYPHLTGLFERLDVPVTKSNMSFGASIRGGRMEYGLASMNAVFAQRKNAFDPRYLRMLRDIVRFNRDGLSIARANPGLTIGGLLEALGTGRWFQEYYLTPFSGAIWSTPKEKILDFPAHAMMQFFDNHALLGYEGQHQWYTVKGGSREYVMRLEAAMRKQGVSIRLKAPVDAVRRTELGPEIKVAGGAWELFDEVIFATHADDSLRMLSDASPAERAALGKVKYQPNEAVLHADERVMPKRRLCWSSWNYTEARDHVNGPIDLTYWMNSLQPIPQDDPMFVTLNSKRDIRDELIYDQATFRHPVYDLDTLQGQRGVAALNGQNATWFCGAWMRNGFHEDGFASAVDVVEAMAQAGTMPVAAQ